MPNSAMRVVFYNLRGCCRATVLAAQVLLIVMSSMSAMGQGYSSLEPPVGVADFRVLIERLELTEVQRETASTLHESFLAALEACTVPFRDLEVRKRRAISTRADNAAELQREYEPALHEFLRARHDLGAAFVADLRAVLDARQERELWPSAERAVRRKSLHRLGAWGMTGWATFDLVTTVGRLNLPEGIQPPINEIISAWELDIDTQLRAREKMWADHMRLTIEEQHRADADIRARDQEISRDVSRINRKYSKNAVLSLPEEDADRLTDAINVVVYPIFADRHRGRECLDQASRLDDLTEDQRANLESMSVRYSRDSAVLDKDVISSTDAAEPEIEAYYRLPIEVRNALSREANDPLNRIRSRLVAARDALEQRTVEAVRAGLTSHQRTRVSALNR